MIKISHDICFVKTATFRLALNEQRDFLIEFKEDKLKDKMNIYSYFNTSNIN